MDIYDRHVAEQDWNHARRKLLYQEVVCYIKKCSVDLYSFEEVQSTLDLKQKVDRGLQEIPISQIRGSVGRYNDFSSAFLPKKKHMRDRWIGVEQAMQKGVTPPIEVYQVGQIYFVLDGNHRVSIARESGYETIEAEVWEFPVSLAEDTEELFIEEILSEEREAFLEQIGDDNKAAAEQISFTIPGNYEELTRHLEIYRQEKAKMVDKSLTAEEIFPAWLEEVYNPSIEAIKRIDFMAMFPGRTEADLFIWSWRNRGELEMLAEV